MTRQQLTQFHILLAITSWATFGLSSVAAVEAEAEVNVAEDHQLVGLDSASESNPTRPPTPVPDRLDRFRSNAPAASVETWLAQTDNPAIVTRVVVTPLPDELEIALETPVGQSLLIDANLFRAEGNQLIAEINNASLTLPEGTEFNQADPSAEVAEVRVWQIAPDRIQVVVTGRNGLPNQDITLKTADLAYSLNVNAGPAEEELVVTGTSPRDRYWVPNSTTATKTDTPILEIPGSVQSIPRQIIDDRQILRINEALENVSGATSLGQYQGYEDLIYLRGFQVSTFQGSFYRDGVRTFTFGSPDLTNLDRIEVLKGPASVLFGQAEPGGIVNLVTKVPLTEPYYAARFSAGRYETYDGAIDLSGPLNAQGSLLYRFNASYRGTDGFRDFGDKERLFIAPALQVNFSENTSLLVDLEYTDDSSYYDTGLVAIGDRPADLPRDRALNEPFSRFSKEEFSLGYVLNHRFSENWSLRHNFRFQQQRPDRYGVFPSELDEATGELTRSGYWAGGEYQNFFTDTNLAGKFRTGSLEHNLLIGFERSKTTEQPEFLFDVEYPSINIFDPVYANQRFSNDPIFFRDDTTYTTGVYLQDRIVLSPKFQLLVGARYDHFEQNRSTEFLPDPKETFEQSDSAVTPRLGLVYQPSDRLSIYGSYTRSFRPSFGASRNGDNSTFKPETGEQFEIGIKAQLNPNLIATLAAYHLTKQNVTTADPNDPSGLFQVQTGEVTSKGIEFDLAGELQPGWKIIASAAYTDARITEDNTLPVGNALDNIPRWSASLWTTYEIQRGSFKGLGFGLGLYYVDRRSGDLNDTFELPSYFRTDASVFYRRDNWKVQLNVRNLFDVDYFSGAPFGSRLEVTPGEPLTILGGVFVEF